MSIINEGITVKRVVINIIKSSTIPPTNPAKSPKISPIPVATIPAIKPIFNEVPIAYISSVSTSLPKLSVPNQKVLRFGTSVTFT